MGLRQQIVAAIGVDFEELLQRYRLLAERVQLYDDAESITSADSPYDLPDETHVLLVDTSGGAVTVNLPPAADVDGQTYVVKKITTDANAVTLDGDGAETIDGSATLAYGGGARSSRTIVSDGSNWHVTGSV